MINNNVRCETGIQVSLKETIGIKKVKLVCTRKTYSKGEIGIKVLEWISLNHRK